MFVIRGVMFLNITKATFKMMKTPSTKNLSKIKVVSLLTHQQIINFTENQQKPGNNQKI